MRDRETPIWSTPDNNTTDPRTSAYLLAVTPDPTPLNRAKAVLVLYTAALYNAWFSNPTELKVRTWAEMFTEPEFTMANLEWAVHEHFRTSTDGHMVPGHVRALAHNAPQTGGTQ